MNMALQEDNELVLQGIPLIANTVAQIVGNKTEAKKQEILQLIREIEDELED